MLLSVVYSKLYTEHNAFGMQCLVCRDDICGIKVHNIFKIHTNIGVISILV